MAKPAAMPIFGDAYISDTRHLTLEEHGAYLMLLLIAWRTDDCSIPDNDKRIAQMLGITAAKWGKLKPTIMAFWTLEDGRWTQKKQAKVRKFVDEKSEKNSLAAKSRWNHQPTENKGSGKSERTSKRSSERICQSDASQSIRTLKSSIRAKHIPEDWKPEPFGEGTDAAAIVGGWSAEHLQSQVERFADHHRAKGSKFADWQAAWGTWVRNSVKFGQARFSSGGSDDRYSFIDQAARDIEQRKRALTTQGAG